MGIFNNHKAEILEAGSRKLLEELIEESLKKGFITQGGINVTIENEIKIYRILMIKSTNPYYN